MVTPKTGAAAREALGCQDVIVSTVRCAVETTPLDLSVCEVLNTIRTGGKKLKGQVTQLRNKFNAELALTGGDRKAAKRLVEGLKKALPSVMWCGRFSNRELPAADKLQKHSGLLCADLDDLGDKLPEIQKKLEASSHVLAFFLSPSGNGLKIVFRVLADAQKHAGSFRAVEKHVRDLTGIEIDPKRKDIAGLCFMSFDPDLYVNWFAIAIRPLPEPEKPKAAFNFALEVNLSERQRIASELLGNIEWTSETSGYCVCPGKHRHTTGDGDRDCKIDFDGVPTVHCFHNHCRGILDAINRELRSRIGKAEFVPTLVRLGDSNLQAADDDSTELTSLSSPAVEYPAPPDEAAFYGLAGEIVWEMEPQTEADSVALLVQFMVAFGSIIHRHAHAVAGGARHYLNLFCVLVGETAKGRKGTAWQHIKELFAAADELWPNRIVNGLSSGEGLIWAVRDPIKKSVPIKEKGRITGYQEEIVDTGVEDKRLCVVEAEFAKVLKVMERENSTLSPVIRSAWDDGNLRILTKNSPACATDAHISIIGHITREEARKNLTEMESANGFANRFCFVAVRRSKCLPEGGEALLVDELVERLQKAIVFARSVGEIKRSEAARKFWAWVYPKLSAGKPGLLGMITARAEAQVLRFSLQYALLDCSRTVEVIHLRAALALWRYFERSAGWVFESGTGSKNADRILAALKVAGEKGLTKWQITLEVFNKHATKFEIDEALRLLHGLKVARCERESTATKPAERWFYVPPTREEGEQSTPEGGDPSNTSHSSPPTHSQNTNPVKPDTDSGEPPSDVITGDLRL